jgi:hypothetical protein
LKLPSFAPFAVARIWTGRVSVALAIATATPALAAEPDEDTRHAARELAREGARKLDQGEYAEALELLERAHTLVPAPTIRLLEARTLDKLGRLVQAAERYEQVRRTQLEPDASEAFVKAVADAQLELLALRKRIPRLVLNVVGGASKAAVELDGKPVPPALIGIERPIDPGEHRIVARRGSLSIERRVELAEGTREVVVLELPEQEGGALVASNGGEPGDGSMQRTLGWVSLGIGAVGVSAGVTFALIARGKQSELDDVCENSRCPAQARDDIDAFERARTLSLVGYGVGIVGIGLGATLVLTAPSGRREQAGILPFVGLGAAGVRGRFH